VDAMILMHLSLNASAAPSYNFLRLGHLRHIIGLHRITITYV
jgi:hypothetical protein